MKRFPQRELRFDAKETTTDLGVKNFIFVGSSTDMWAEVAPAMWMEDVIRLCHQFHNRYLFQSKNPERFGAGWDFPPLTMLGTTKETNRDYAFQSKAPSTWSRKVGLQMRKLPKMVSLEPIMDFDLAVLPRWIEDIAPEFVSIGADSKGTGLPEPSADKLRRLITELEKITIVKIKANLSRLLPTNPVSGREK
jgi:hypothetical protein